ncbi:hypothetical protein Tco_1190339 [Tanacetum coccineum]
MMNGRNPLTLNFKTFTESIGLNYYDGTYVSHPSPEDPSKVTPIELTASMIGVNNRGTSMSPLPFTIKTKKKKSQTVTPTLPKILRKPISLIKTYYLYLDIDLERNIQLAGKGSHSPLNEETRKSQPLPKGTTTNPKYLGGNIQPADKELPSMIFDECTVKTTPLPEGPHGDKDSDEFKPPPDMEPLTTLVVDPSGTDAKYHADQTQPARLRYRSLTKKALLLSDDELMKESEDEVFEAGDEMDEDIHHTYDEETQSPSPNKEQPESSHA